jgi:hypothetical protein
MKTFSTVKRASMLVAAGTLVSAQGPCVKSGFSLELIQASCNFSSLLQVFTPFFNDPINSGDSCNRTAESELIALLGQPTRVFAENTLHDVCKAALDSQYSVPLESVPRLGQNFIKQFYNGHTKWNEQYATMYPTEKDGNQTNVLKRQASKVNDFFNGGASKTKVAWPDYTSSFASCKMNSAYCCWT